MNNLNFIKYSNVTHLSLEKVNFNELFINISNVYKEFLEMNGLKGLDPRKTHDGLSYYEELIISDYNGEILGGSGYFTIGDIAFKIEKLTEIDLFTVCDDFLSEKLLEIDNDIDLLDEDIASVISEFIHEELLGVDIDYIEKLINGGIN